MKEIVGKVALEFANIQKNDMGIDLLEIKLHNEEFLPSFEIRLKDNLFIRSRVSVVSDYSRECITRLFASYGKRLAWNNTGDIFWERKL